MEVDLPNVICIKVSSHTEQQLDDIAFTYNISFDFLWEAKEQGCKLLWIHKGGGYVIAGLDTDNTEDVYFSEQYLPMTLKLRKKILSIKPVKVPKRKDNKNTTTIQDLESQLTDAVDSENYELAAKIRDLINKNK